MSESPAKSSGFLVYRGRSAATAVAAIKRSTALLPHAFRPDAITAAYTRPYARATLASIGSGSNVASVRCSRSWRFARSAISLVACGPAANSASVTAEIAISIGSWLGSISGKSMSTEVSISPRGARSSAAGRDILVNHCVDIFAKAPRSNPRRSSERRQHGFGSHEGALPQRAQLSDRYTVACDDKRPSSVEVTHNAPALIAKLSLCNSPRHVHIVARALHAGGQSQSGAVDGLIRR